MLFAIACGLAANASAAQAKKVGKLEVDVGGLPRGESVKLKITGVASKRVRYVKRQGVTRFSGLPIGRYRLSVSSRRFTRATGSGAVKGLRAVPEIACQPGASCHGRARVIQVTSIHTRRFRVRFTSGRVTAGVMKQFTGSSFGLCGLRGDGIVRCWGGWSEASPPSGQAIELGTGGEGICVVRPDGSGDCGDGTFSPRGVKLHGVSSAAERHCGIRGPAPASGPIVCWGPGVKKGNPPAGSYREVVVLSRSLNRYPGSAGEVCGRRDDGSVACGGGKGSYPPGTAAQIYGEYEQLLALSPSGARVLLDGRPADPGPFAALVPGSACGLLTTGAIRCAVDGENDVQTDAGPYAEVVPGRWQDTVCGILRDGGLRCFAVLPSYLRDRERAVRIRDANKLMRIPVH